VHIAEVEIDPDTGHMEIVAYTAVDDCGNVLDGGVEDERRAPARQSLRHRGNGLPPDPDVEDRRIDALAAGDGQCVAHRPAATGHLGAGVEQDRFEFHEKESIVLD
jgi:hypothetical protein